MKKVLLTGATGFIGSQVTKELLNRGYEVHALVYSTLAPKQENFIQHEINLLDVQAVERFMSVHNFENLIHLAWYVGPKCQISSLNLDWLCSSIKLMETFYKNGGKTLLGAGSMSEYDFSYGWCKEDTTPLVSPSLYGQAKASLYLTIKKYTQFHGGNFKWGRLFNLYGPNERATRFVPYVINSMLKQEDVKVSQCTQIQNYLHVSDAANAIVSCLESPINGAINICADQPVQLRTIVNKIAELTNFNGKILWGAIPASFEQPFISGSNSILTQKVGWQQQISLDKGLKDTIDWWRTYNV